MRKTAPLVCALFSASCAHHVTLPQAPAPTAPLGERLTYYGEFAPNSELAITTVASNGRGAVAISNATQLVLRNGETVMDADDLRPALHEATPAARALERRAHAKRKANMWGS